MGGGVYTYRFGTTLPANYDTTLTHTLGIYGRRDLREWGLSFYVGNPTKDFVPNGSPVTQIHEIAVTASCNQCHDPLALHGETGRREVQICVLCHTPQTIDPDTGEPQDMKVLIHKIHRSSSLPSVTRGHALHHYRQRPVGERLLPHHVSDGHPQLRQLPQGASSKRRSMPGSSSRAPRRAVPATITSISPPARTMWPVRRTIRSAPPAISRRASSSLTLRWPAPTPCRTSRTSSCSPSSRS